MAKRSLSADEIAESVSSKQLKSFRERLNDKLSEIVGEDPKCLLGLAELLGAAVALKSVIIEYIDPSVLLKNKKKSSIRRLAASMESMSLLQEIEKRIGDVIDESIEEVVDNNPRLGKKVKRMLDNGILDTDDYKPDKKDISKLYDEMEDLMEGDEDAFKSTEPAEA